MLRPPSSSQARAGVSGWTGRNRGLPGQQGGEAQRWPGLWRAAHPLRPQQVDRGEQQPPREQRHPSERHDHYWRRPDHRLGGGTYTPACRQEWYRLICWASGRQEPPWGSDGKGTCVANTVCRMQQLGFGSPGPGIVGTSAPVSASALPSLGRGGGGRWPGRASACRPRSRGTQTTYPAGRGARRSPAGRARRPPPPRPPQRRQQGPQWMHQTTNVCGYFRSIPTTSKREPECSWRTIWKPKRPQVCANVHMSSGIGNTTHSIPFDLFDVVKMRLSKSRPPACVHRVTGWPTRGR